METMETLGAERVPLNFTVLTLAHLTFLARPVPGPCGPCGRSRFWAGPTEKKKTEKLFLDWGYVHSVSTVSLREQTLDWLW